MEEKKTNLMQHALTYGAIISLVSIVYSVILYIAGLTFNRPLGYIQYVILFIGLIISTKAYRDKVKGGFISYGNALGYGILVTVIVAIISVAFSFILMKFIDPGLIDKFKEVMEEKMQSKGMTDDQIEMAINMSVKWMTAVWAFPIFVIIFSFFGFILSLISSAFIKKDSNNVAKI